MLHRIEKSPFNWVVGRPGIGDIIRSPKFAFGFRMPDEPTNNPMLVGDFYKSEKRRVRRIEAAWDGGPYYREVEAALYDETRGKALFVVVETQPQIPHPHGWRVRARRLLPSGEYDPEGELIEFRMQGLGTDVISTVEIIGRMKQVFVKEEE